MQWLPFDCLGAALGLSIYQISSEVELGSPR
jgi:hypothetical protein